MKEKTVFDYLADYEETGKTVILADGGVAEKKEAWEYDKKN